MRLSPARHHSHWRCMNRSEVNNLLVFALRIELIKSLSDVLDSGSLPRTLNAISDTRIMHSIPEHTSLALAFANGGIM